MFENDNLNNTLEMLAKTERHRYASPKQKNTPTLLFFFSGGREVPFDGERRIMIPSPKVATYDLQPEMSAIELTDAIVPEIERKRRLHLS